MNTVILTLTLGFSVSIISPLGLIKYIHGLKALYCFCQYFDCLDMFDTIITGIYVNALQEKFIKSSFLLII